MARRTRLATAFTSLILAAAASAGDFIRVDEDDSAARLQTAVTRYEKEGESVELIGAVHIADKAYYQTLTTRFQAHYPKPGFVTHTHPVRPSKAPAKIIHTGLMRVRSKSNTAKALRPYCFQS